MTMFKLSDSTSGRLAEEATYQKIKDTGANPDEFLKKMKSKASKRRGADLGWTKGTEGLEATQKAIGEKKLTGKELSAYDPQSLTAMQNIKALGHEFKPGMSWRPDKVIKKGWKNLGEGAGGYAGGTGYARYAPVGGKAMTGAFSIGDFKDTLNRSDPSGEGRSRTERLGHALGGLAGGTAGVLSAKSTGRLGMLGMPANIALSLAGMTGGYYVGGKAGKGVDYLASKARGVEEGDYTRTQRAKLKKKLRSV